MRHSESMTALAKALVAAQKDIDNAAKKSTNLGLKNKYADLESVRDACHDAYAKNGLVVVQGCVDADDNRVHLATRILHESGEWIESVTPVPVGAPNSAQTPAQCFGAALTYARRYALAAIAGITQEDDDGNSAGTAHTTHATPPPAPRKPAPAPAPAATGALTWRAVYKRMCEVDGLTKEDAAGKRKLDQDYFRLCALKKIKPKMSDPEWTPEECLMMLQAVDEYVENPAILEADPFADQ